MQKLFRLTVVPFAALLVCALALPVPALEGEIPIEVIANKKQAKKLGVDLERLAKAVPVLRQEITNDLLPNAAVYVYRKGELIWQVEMGFRDLETREAIDSRSIFRMFSMTKPLTAAAVMLLVEDGLLLLNDPISKFLPEFADMKVLVQSTSEQRKLEPARRSIQVRDLLTHTDGLTYHFMPSPLATDYSALGIEPGNPRPEGRKHPSLASMVADLASLPLVHQPGASWHYGVGLDVAGRLVEVVSGMPFDLFIDKRLLRPLSMKDTSFSTHTRTARKRLTTLYQHVLDKPDLQKMDDPQESGWAELPAVVSGGGGLIGTGKDYANFANMLLNRGQYRGQQVLSSRSVEIMMSDQLSSEYGTGTVPWLPPLSYDYKVTGIGYGLGGAVYRDYGLSDLPLSPGSYTWGGAAGTKFWVDPQKDLVVVFLTQVLEMGPTEVDNLQDRLTNLVYQAILDISD